MKIFSPFHNLFYKSCVLPCPIIQWINHALIVKQVLLGCSNLMQWLNEMETLVGYGSMYICPSSSSIMPLKKLKKRYKYLKFRLGRKWTKCKCICLGILLPQSITGVKDNCRPHLLSHHITLVVTVSWSYLLFDILKKQRQKQNKTKIRKKKKTRTKYIIIS